MTEKDLDSFGNNKTKKDGRQTLCRVCVKEINADYYKRTPEKNVDRTARNKAMRVASKKFMLEYLKDKCCMDCGESNSIVLEFDHVLGNKSFNISSAVAKGMAIASIEKEMLKCVIRCANCHRIKTAKDFGWYKVLTDTDDDVKLVEQ